MGPSPASDGGGLIPDVYGIGSPPATIAGGIFFCSPPHAAACRPKREGKTGTGPGAASLSARKPRGR